MFLFEINEVRDEASHRLLEFKEYKGEKKAKLRDAAEKLGRNINSLLPGYLNLPSGSSILEDEKVNEKLLDQLNCLGGERSLTK